MDIPLDDLMRFLTPLLPYLLRAGEKAAEEAGRRIAGDAWEGAKSIWGRMVPGLKRRPAAQEALQDALSSPQDEDAQAALRLQLKKLLAEDPALAADLVRLVQAREVHIYIHPPSTPERPRPIHNLPNPDYLRFVGRERELDWLRQRLHPRDRAWLLFITGIGGVGKSALALRIAHEYRERYGELPPEERFDAIIWASAKEQVLTPAGREAAGPPGLVSRTLADIYQTIAQALDREAITRAAPEGQDREVQKALTAQRTLLIVDNLDTMDEAVRAFLRHLPAPTKAIVTSREWLDVADVLRLYGMEREDALALMEVEAEAQGVVLSPEEKERLYGRTAGLPLPIRLSLARLGSGETFEQVMRWLGNATGDLPLYCVGGQVELARQRDPNAYRLLLACSLFDREAGASREVLGEVADLSAADRDDGLTLLWRLNLVNRSADDRFWMLPIVQEYVRERVGQEEGGAVLVGRWLDWALEFARRWAADLDTRMENLPIVAAEYPNLRQALVWCEEHQQWETFIVLVDSVWFYLYVTGLIAETRRMLDAAAHLSEAPGQETLRVRLLRHLGMVQWDQGEREAAIRTLQQAVEIARKHQDLKELGLALDRLSDSFLDSGEPEKGEPLAREAFSIGEAMGDLQLKVLAAYRLSLAESARGDLDAALEWLDRGEEWARELGWARALAWYAYRRGVNLIQNGRPMEAEPWLLRAIERMTWDEPRLVAYAKAWLAEAYRMLGRWGEARRSAAEAAELIDRIGLHVLRERVERILQEPLGVT